MGFNKYWSVGIIAIVNIALVAGAKNYGEQCSIFSQAAGLISNEAKDNACDVSKSLICVLDKCGCNPDRVYEEGWTSLVTGGKCLVRPPLPCSQKDDCVANAVCSNQLCSCKEGYHSKEGHCTNASIRTSSNVLYLVGLLVSYLVLSH